jgi:hypothetical protein
MDTNSLNIRLVKWCLVIIPYQTFVKVTFGDRYRRRIFKRISPCPPVTSQLIYRSIQYPLSEARSQLSSQPVSLPVFSACFLPNGQPVRPFHVINRMFRNITLGPICSLFKHNCVSSLSSAISAISVQRWEKRWTAFAFETVKRIDTKWKLHKAIKHFTTF